MGVSYSYKFVTGMTVTFSQKEKDEIERLTREETARMEKEHMDEFGSTFEWRASNKWMPYDNVIRKYFKHDQD